jgi:hypothetical protein
MLEIKSVNDVRKFTNPWYQELKKTEVGWNNAAGTGGERGV